MRSAVVALACLLPLAALGCGSSSHKPTHAREAPAHQAAPSVRYSQAKRRYLAHFNGDCASANRLAAAQSHRIQVLTQRIARGDRRAVGELAVYLQRLAHGYGRELALAQRLGPPPPPDASFGAAYIAAARTLTGAIAALAKSVAARDASGISAAEATIAKATAVAGVAAKRYGFRQCGGATPAAPSLSA